MSFSPSRNSDGIPLMKAFNVIDGDDNLFYYPCIGCCSNCPYCPEDNARESYTLTITGTSVLGPGCITPNLSPFFLDNLWMPPGSPLDFDGTYTLTPMEGYTCCWGTTFQGPVYANVTCDAGGPIVEPASYVGGPEYPYQIMVCKDTTETWSLWIEGYDGALVIQLWGQLDNTPQQTAGTLCNDDDSLPIWTLATVNSWMTHGTYQIGETGTAVLS